MAAAAASPCTPACRRGISEVTAPATKEAGLTGPEMTGRSAFAVPSAPTPPAKSSFVEASTPR